MTLDEMKTLRPGDLVVRNGVYCGNDILEGDIAAVTRVAPPGVDLDGHKYEHRVDIMLITGPSKGDKFRGGGLGLTKWHNFYDILAKSDECAV